MNEGILCIDKKKGISSFYLIPRLRRIYNTKKVGHTGTLDPLASGLMIYLIGKTYTKQCDKFLKSDKEYDVTAKLGVVSDTYDITGDLSVISNENPRTDDLIRAINSFQGGYEQEPPMYSALKYKGKPPYKCARGGIDKIKVKI